MRRDDQEDALRKVALWRDMPVQTLLKDDLSGNHTISYDVIRRMMDDQNLVTCNLRKCQECSAHAVLLPSNHQGERHLRADLQDRLLGSLCKDENPKTPRNGSTRFTRLWKSTSEYK